MGLLRERRRTRVEAVRVDGLTYHRYVNEFWTSAQRRGHSLHEVSYRACFKAELPRFFIELLSEPGDLVYDPYMGRGTTVLEGALLGRRVAGNDVNPLAHILIRPRLEPVSCEEIADRLRQVPVRGDERAEIELGMFYSRATEAQVVALRSYLLAQAASGAEDSVDRWVRMVATTRLTGHSSGFFSVYTLPPNQAVTPSSQRRINARRRQEPPDRDVRGIIARKARSLLRDLRPSEIEELRRAGEDARLFCLDAGAESPLEAGSVQLVVTSPPFLDVVQYATDNWLRCWFNAIDAEEVGRRITQARTVDAWAQAVLEALRELRRVVRPGGWVAFEVGEVRGGKLNLDEVVAPLGVRAGFECYGVVVNEQEFTKTANCWGVSNNRRGTNTNRVVLLRG